MLKSFLSKVLRPPYFAEHLLSIGPMTRLFSIVLVVADFKADFEDFEIVWFHM